MTVQLACTHADALRGILDYLAPRFKGPVTIAESAAGYMQLALQLGRNPERLAALRAVLRDRILASPLSDTAAFTRHLENAYRSMWRRFCATRVPQ